MLDTNYKIIHGDVISSLKTLPDQSVHVICSSPPYYGLRNYGTPDVIWGGDEKCDHSWSNIGKATTKNSKQGSTESVKHPNLVDQQKPGTDQAVCEKCNAWRGQFGLERMASCGISESNLLQIRDDLSNEDKEYVMNELKKLGLM